MRTFKLIIPLAIISLALAGCSWTDNKGSCEIDISGQWGFQLDREDIGVEERWFLQALSDEITLPNSLDAAGKGDKNSPALAQAGRLTLDTEYTGVAWYRKEVSIPEEWRNKSIVLYMERVHWAVSYTHLTLPTN